MNAAATTTTPAQVAKAAFDSSTRKWVLEGAVRTPVASMKDLKTQPPINPWNLGVYDALVLADKMTGCPGGCHPLGVGGVVQQAVNCACELPAHHRRVLIRPVFTTQMHF